jgi:esterase
MDKQGLERACVLGHSMGGKVAMQLALLAPDRVDRVIVADISPVAYKPRHDAILEGLKAMDFSAVSSRTEADRQMANFVADAGVRQFLLKNLERIPEDQAIEGGPVFRWLLNLATIECCYSELTDAPQGEGPFEGPMLFIKGADSAYLQSKHKDVILQLFPNASVKVIEGTGHWLHAEKPDTFATLCVDFLATDD